MYSPFRCLPGSEIAGSEGNSKLLEKPNQDCTRSPQPSGPEPSLQEVAAPGAQLQSPLTWTFPGDPTPCPPCLCLSPSKLGRCHCTFGYVRRPPPPGGGGEQPPDTIPWHGALHEALRDTGLGGGPPEVLLSPLPTPPTALPGVLGFLLTHLSPSLAQSSSRLETVLFMMPRGLQARRCSQNRRISEMKELGPRDSD